MPRLAWLALSALLFQQLATVAYACAMPDTQVTAAQMAAHCEALPAPAADSPLPAICVKHCNPDSMKTTDARPLGVPPLALPPAPLFVAQLVAPLRADWLEPPASSVDPPPMLRFCSLLI